MSIHPLREDEASPPGARRQFVCGVDVQTRWDLASWRDWIRARFFEQAEIFAIDLCAYAAMSNHYLSGFQPAWRVRGDRSPVMRMIRNQKKVSAEMCLC